jgi:hypothetical protein
VCYEQMMRRVMTSFLGWDSTSRVDYLRHLELVSDRRDDIYWAVMAFLAKVTYRGIGRLQSNVHVYTLGWLQAQGRGRTLLPAGFMFILRKPSQVFGFFYPQVFARLSSTDNALCLLSTLSILVSILPSLVDDFRQSSFQVTFQQVQHPCESIEKG